MKCFADYVFDGERALGQYMMKGIRIEMRRGGFIEGVLLGRYTHPKGEVYLRVGCGYPESEAIRNSDVADGVSIELYE